MRPALLSRSPSAHVPSSLLSHAAERVAPGVADERGHGRHLAVGEHAAEAWNVAPAVDAAPHDAVHVLEAVVVREDGDVLCQGLVAVGAMAGGADAAEHCGDFAHERGHVV